MLPTRVIVNIEKQLEQPNGRVLIMHPNRRELERIRHDDMARIAFPSRVSKSDRFYMMFENRSLIKFSLVNDTELRGRSYEYIVLLDLSERDKRNILPMASSMEQSGRCQVDILDHYR